MFQGLLLFASPVRAEPVIVKNVDIMGWPTNLTSSDVLDLYTEIINSDPEAKSILDRVNLKLSNHGIHHLREIFKYCDGVAPSKYATAFFAQNSKVVETRISIPGVAENPWSSSTLNQLKSAFSFEIIKTAFFDSLVLNDKPQICIYQGQSLLSSYDSFVHELTHFLLKDPSLYNKELLSSDPFPDFINMIVTEAGGELDAFKVGSSAAIRMLKKYNITGYSSESYKFFDSDGNLRDEDGLKKYLIEVYTRHYKDTNTELQLKQSKSDSVNVRIKILVDNIKPIIQNLNSLELSKSLDVEIKKLEKLKSQL